jgi:hypothetical protein
MSYEDPLERRVREVNEAQQRREAAKQRVLDDARRRAEASGAAEFGRNLSRFADAVDGFDRYGDNWMPDPVDPGAIAANGLAWGQVREAGGRLARDAGTTRR